MKYIVQLSEEIQAMEGGDLDHPITVQGSDELTTLASSLDSMRLTLRQQHEDEAAAAAKVKNLIALSLPGTPETNKLFNAERFARCKDGAILINVGRGTTVDSDALVEALRSGKIFGAGLDVTDPEPLPADHPLWGEPGAIITPHNSGKFSLPKTLDNIVDIFIHNLKRYAEGLPLDNQVNRTTRYAADQNGGHRLLSTL